MKKRPRPTDPGNAVVSTVIAQFDLFMYVMEAYKVPLVYENRALYIRDAIVVTAADDPERILIRTDDLIDAMGVLLGISAASIMAQRFSDLLRLLNKESRGN